jgi:hypothetical protein
MTKLPPKSKIYEAYSAIADNRIELNENSAIVTSSDYRKKYEVKWHDLTYSSTDNATFWQGYPGYPVIVVLMLQGKLTYNSDTIPFFKNINWHALNEKNKRNYDKSVAEILSSINCDTEKIQKEVDSIYNEINKLEIVIKRKI